MLGRPFEISLHAPDTGASFDFYQRLGFAAATAGDMWPHAYGVMCCEGLAIGLHGTARRPLVITFVQPDVTRLHREFEALDIPVERAVLGSDAFNYIEFTDPAGVVLRVIEARSFSAPALTPAVTVLGSFQRLSLPALHPRRVEQFWQGLGCEESWLLAWHHPAEQPGPVLMFRHADPAAAMRLRTPEDLLVVVSA